MEQVHKLDGGNSTGELHTSKSLREQYRTVKGGRIGVLIWIHFQDRGRNQLRTSNKVTCHKHGALKRSKLQGAARAHIGEVGQPETMKLDGLDAMAPGQEIQRSHGP